MVANIDTMAYVGEKPWHGLGTEVPNIMTAEEAIVAGGLNWNVEKKPIYFENIIAEEGGVRRSNDVLIPDKFATVRMDKNIPLGVVGKQYTVLPNKDAFSFLDAVITSKEAVYHTVGSLGQGEVIWLLAKLPRSIKVIHDDVVDQYLLLSNSHNGSSAVTVRWTPIRVVCQNTLTASFRNSTHVINIHHTPNMGDKVAEARRILGISSEFYDMFGQMAKKMVKKEFVKSVEKDFFDKIGLGEDDTEDSTRKENMKEEISKYIVEGTGNNMKDVRGTVWAAYNGVTYWVDHVKNVKASKRFGKSNKLQNIWWGSGAEMKRKAWDASVELVLNKN